MKYIVGNAGFHALKTLNVYKGHIHQKEIIPTKNNSSSCLLHHMHPAPTKLFSAYDSVTRYKYTIFGKQALLTHITVCRVHRMYCTWRTPPRCETTYVSRIIKAPNPTAAKKWVRQLEPLKGKSYARKNSFGEYRIYDTNDIVHYLRNISCVEIVDVPSL